MEGDRKITLLEPGPEIVDPLSGQRKPGPAIPRVAWAIRRDRGGSEGLQADTRIGEWQTRFEVRMDGLSNLGHTWSLTDERGREYDIEAVSEVPTGRNRWWWIYAVARS